MQKSQCCRHDSWCPWCMHTGAKSLWRTNVTLSHCVYLAWMNAFYLKAHKQSEEVAEDEVKLPAAFNGHASKHTLCDSDWILSNFCTNTHRHRDLGQLFANAVLHNTPQVERIIGFVWDACPPLLQGQQLLRRGLLVHHKRLLIKLKTESSVSNQHKSLWEWQSFIHTFSLILRNAPLVLQNLTTRLQLYNKTLYCIIRNDEIMGVNGVNQSFETYRLVIRAHFTVETADVTAWPSVRD